MGGMMLGLSTNFIQSVRPGFFRIKNCKMCDRNWNFRNLKANNSDSLSGLLIFFRLRNVKPTLQHKYD